MTLANKPSPITFDDWSGFALENGDRKELDTKPSYRWSFRALGKYCFDATRLPIPSSTASYCSTAGIRSYCEGTGIANLGVAQIYTNRRLQHFGEDQKFSLSTPERRTIDALAIPDKGFSINQRYTSILLCSSCGFTSHRHTLVHALSASIRVLKKKVCILVLWHVSVQHVSCA